MASFLNKRPRANGSGMERVRFSQFPEGVLSNVFRFQNASETKLEHEFEKEKKKRNLVLMS